METIKLTAKQYAALRYVRAARPFVGATNSACPAPTLAVLKRLGLVEEHSTGVGCFGVVLKPTTAGEAYLTERRLANEAALRAHLSGATK